MNDARTDVPTPGSSSVDAYEEDWYRSLRALAERRRSEFERFDEEDIEHDDVSTPEATDTSARSPADDWAVPPGEHEAAGHEAAGPGTSAEADVSPGVEASAVGTSDPGTKRTHGASEHLDDVGEGDVHGPGVADVPAEGIAGVPDAFGPTTSAWARVLKPLERTDPAPLPATHEPEGPSTPEDEIRAGETVTRPDDGDRIDVRGGLETSSAIVEAVETAADAETAPRVPFRADPGGIEQQDNEPDVVEGSDGSTAAAEDARVADPGEHVFETTGFAPAVDSHIPHALSDDRAAIEPDLRRGAESDGFVEIATPHLEPAAAMTASDVPAEIDMAIDEIGREVEPAAGVPLDVGVEATHGPRFATAVGSDLGDADALTTPEPESAGPSLRSREPAERRMALIALAEREVTAAELDTVDALILDPDPEIRRLAIETLSRTPARLTDVVVRRALQDPADEVRAAAVRAAATRDIRDLPTLVPLLGAHRFPETHRTIVEVIAKILGEAQLTAEAIGPLLLAVAQMQSPLDETGRLAMPEICASIGTTLLIEGLKLPDARRLGAVRLLADDHSHAVLHALAELAGDPLEEVRQAGLAAAREVGRIEADAARVAGRPDIGALVQDVRSPDPEIPSVNRALGDSDPHVRATAVEWMPSAPTDDVGPDLAQALTDPDERVRLAAIERLARFSSVEPAVGWSVLRGCRVEERDQLLDAFQRTNPNLVLEIALEHLSSPDHEERRLAVEMAGWGGGEAAVESAIRALGDLVPEVRRAAVGALERLRDRSAVAALGKALSDPDADVRVDAVRALGVIDDEGVLAFLVTALKDPDQRVREITSHVLTEWSSPAVAKRLAGVLAVPSLRESAADLLRRIGPSSVELLIDVLLQGSAEIRHTVGPLLEQIIGIEEFLGRLDSPEPERRLRAIEALGAIAGPLAIDALTRSLSDPDARIHLRTTQLLRELGDPTAADAVRRLVDEPVPDVAASLRYAPETNVGTRTQDPPGDHS